MKAKFKLSEEPIFDVVAEDNFEQVVIKHPDKGRLYLVFKGRLEFIKSKVGGMMYIMILLWVIYCLCASVVLKLFFTYEIPTFYFIFFLIQTIIPLTKAFSRKGKRKEL